MKKPKAGDQVALVVAGQGRVVGRVDQVGEDFVKVALAKGAKGLKIKREDEATLLYAGGGGVAELKGGLRRDGFSSSSVRFEFEATKQGIQRRRHVRVDAELPVLLRMTRPDATLIKTQTLNVSGGGMEVVDKVGLPIGALVKIELRLPGDALPLPVTGRIVRRARVNTKGVQIERMLASDQQRLVKFIFTRQRLELRAQKGTA